jgi:hypothetical protein
MDNNRRRIRKTTAWATLLEVDGSPAHEVTMIVKRLTFAGQAAA